MASCKEVIRQISSYLDGDIDEELKQTLELHVKGCEHCHVIFNTTRKTIELYCNGRLFLLPDAVRELLHAAPRRRWAEKTR